MLKSTEVVGEIKNRVITIHVFANKQLFDHCP